jgi:hypothetical protein
MSRSQHFTFHASRTLVWVFNKLFRRFDPRAMPQPVNRNDRRPGACHIARQVGRPAHQHRLPRNEAGWSQFRIPRGEGARSPSESRSALRGDRARPVLLDQFHRARAVIPAGSGNGTHCEQRSVPLTEFRTSFNEADAVGEVPAFSATRITLCRDSVARRVWLPPGPYTFAIHRPVSTYQPWRHQNLIMEE